MSACIIAGAHIQIRALKTANCAACILIENKTNNGPPADQLIRII